MKNYLEIDHISYSIQLTNNNKINLYEHVDGVNKITKTKMASIGSWRSDVIRKFFSRISGEPREFGEEHALKSEYAMKLYLAIKIASSMEQRIKIESVLDVVNSISDEEIVFWVWKIMSMKENAVCAFKRMYSNV
jgi:hypothetical protein